jgi:hypothetical protein
VLAAVRALNRVELVTETMRHALTVLADVAPEWLRAVVAYLLHEGRSPVRSAPPPEGLRESLILS